MSFLRLVPFVGKRKGPHSRVLQGGQMIHVLIARVRLSATILLIAAVVATTLLLPPSGGVAEGADFPQEDAGEELNDPDLAVVVQSPQEAAAMDEALVASQDGLGASATSQHLAVSDGLGALQEKLLAETPDTYAGAILPADPNDPATLYIKGTADRVVEDAVADAGIDVTVVEGMPHSWYELEDLSIQLSEYLSSIGYQDMTTSFDETTGSVEATITRLDGLPLTAPELRPELPPGLKNAEITFTDLRPSELHAFGGMRVYGTDTGGKCTSGWPVSDGSVTGVTTAGHCDGMNRIHNPLATDGSPMSMSHKNEHQGEWGDIEWKTTPHKEPERFFANSSAVRDILAVEPRDNIALGERVCVYGRSSDDRYCGAQVLRKSIQCTIDGIYNNRLVAMDDTAVLTRGDSGGGYSFVNRAYGSVKGFCLVDDRLSSAWSVADLYDEALGIHVRQQ
jgi:streptogrisin C